MRCLGVALGVLLGWGTVAVAEGAPANPFPMEVFQPDGTRMELTNRGDEFCFWVETPEGYTVIQNSESGFWEYARKKLVARELVAGGVRVDPQGSPPPGTVPHLRPRRFDALGGTPERGDPVEVSQGGKKILLVPWSDGVSSWWETLSGYAVAKNRASGEWEYAQLHSVEILEPSGHIYRPGIPAPSDMPRHEKPSVRTPY